MINKYLTAEHAASVLRKALSGGQLESTTKSAVFHNLSLMKGKIVELHASLPAEALHAVAVKANPLVEVLKIIVNSDANTGLEAASMEEVYIGLKAGCPPERIVYDSPVKTMAELEESLSLGIHINADNFEEILRIEKILQNNESLSNIGLRVNPLVGPGNIKTTSVADKASKFGVPMDEGYETIIQMYKDYPWLNAIHVHVGSQGYLLDDLALAVERANGLRKEINKRLRSNQVRILDIGGGLPVAYSEKDTAPSIADYGQILRRKVPGIFSDDVQVITEFGRTVHANAGWAVTRVEYVKAAGSNRLVAVHLGADFLLRPVYQPQYWTHQMVLLDRNGCIKEGQRRKWRIAGPLCFADDIIGRDVVIPDAEPGDYLLILDIGAYTLSMWSRHCSRGIPIALGYYGMGESGFNLLHRGETPDDIAQFWSAG